MATAPRAVSAAIAPSGCLRVAVNASNFVLVSHPKLAAPARGCTPAFQGVAPDVAQLLADALGVELALVPYDSPGALAAAAELDAWDVAVLGVEPARAEAIAFTAPVVEIDATFAVPPASPLLRPTCDRDGDDGLWFDLLRRVDRPGVRVAVAASSAYDLWLTRRLTRAALVRGAEGPGVDRHRAALDLATRGDAQGPFDALAGLRPWLVQHAPAAPAGAAAPTEATAGGGPAGWVVLPGRFTAVAQALGRPRRCADGGGSLFLERFVGDLKASGRAQALLEKHGVHQMASVAK